MTQTTNAEIVELCRREWGLQAVNGVTRLEPESGSAGLFRVEAESGDFLLTLQRDGRIPGSLQRMASVAESLAARGFPTPTYLPTREGGPALDRRGALYTLRPWVPGSPLPRQKLGEGQMSLLGKSLGWCHRLLADIPGNHAASWQARVSSAITEIDALTGRIAARRETLETDREVLAILNSRRTLLESAPNLNAVFSGIPAQVIHGDYHVDNVIVDGDGDLAAVIDLEPVSGYPAREVCYALFWSLPAWDISTFDMGLAHALVAGYLDEAHLSSEELEVGPEMLSWWLLLAMRDTRRYADDPRDADALDGVSWFHSLALWLRNEGRGLGIELARLGQR